MKQGLVLVFAAVIAVFFCVPFGIAADDREVLVVPKDVRTKFLREMSRHMAGFDEILSAIAEEDFKGAARIAENNMRFGRNIWVEMAARGMAAENIAELQNRYPKMNAAERQKISEEMGVQGATVKPGSFDHSVQLFYSATGKFAEVAKYVGDKPTPTDYENVIEALHQITSICRGCHDAYQLK
jgi:hypothetical protein